MFFATRARKLYQISAVLALVTTLAACSKDEEPDDEPDIGSMRLAVGTQTITVTSGGVVTGGPIVIPVGSTPISATFLLPNGQVETKVTDATFRLDVTTDAAGTASFTRAGNFNGSLVGGTAGSTVLRFALFHLAEQHNDFGPFPVPVTVQ
jgi:hypothetical protein